jgi:hypothetical protein
VAIVERHHRTARDVVERRVLAVIDRLDVAMQFSMVDTSVSAQTLHAVEFALRGPQGRDDDDYLSIDPDEALALVRALLPFVREARRRPGCEGCSKCLGTDHNGSSSNTSENTPQRQL